MRAIPPAVTVLAALALVLSPTVAQAQPPSDPDRLDAEVQQVLELAPGGVEIAPGQIAWNDGAVVLTLEAAVTPYTLAQCASGRYCAWTGVSYTGNVFSYSSCSTSGTPVSLPTSYAGRSVANKRSTGYVIAGSYTVNAGNSFASVPAFTLMNCYS